MKSNDHISSKAHYIIFLELLSLAPIFILLGNIVPPFPIKLHFIGLGFLFLISLFILINNPKKKWFIYFIGAYLAIQLLQDYWDIKSFIDLFFGSTILICTIEIVANPIISNQTLEKYTNRFQALMWIPITIAVLQYLELLPVTFWNATYVNYAYSADGLATPRPNGLLYHGSELSIILCFAALFQFFQKEKKAFWMIIALLIISLMTYFKAVVGCVGLLFLYYLSYINKGTLSNFRIISKPWLIFLIVTGGVIVSFFAINYFRTVHYYTGFYFPDQMLTGRGTIWNIYFDAINEFSIFNYLFGAGAGASFKLFTEYATPENFYPLTISAKTDVAFDPHNALLSIFISSGIVGLSFFLFLYRMILSQVKRWYPSPDWNKKVLIGVVLIPLITIGITIGIFDMAIYWCCLSVLLIRWFTFNQNKEELKPKL